MKLLTAQFDMMVPLYMDYDRAIKDKTVDMALDKFPDIPIMLIDVLLMDTILWGDDE